MISGLLSAVTVLSAFLQPAAVFVEDPEPAAYEADILHWKQSGRNWQGNDPMQASE